MQIHKFEGTLSYIDYAGRLRIVPHEDQRTTLKTRLKTLGVPHDYTGEFAVQLPAPYAKSAARDPTTVPADIQQLIGLAVIIHVKPRKYSFKNAQGQHVTGARLILQNIVRSIII